MFQVKQHEKILKNEINKLKNEIQLLVFTDIKEIDGKKVRRCMLCDSTISLLEKLAEFSGGRLIVEEKSVETNKDIAKKYNVKRIPTILFIDKEEKEVIRYLGNPLGAEVIRLS